MCLSVLIFRWNRLGHEAVKIPEIRCNHWGECACLCVLRSKSGGEWLRSLKGQCTSVKKTWLLHSVTKNQSSCFCSFVKSYISYGILIFFNIILTHPWCCLKIGNTCKIFTGVQGALLKWPSKQSDSRGIIIFYGEKSVIYYCYYLLHPVEVNSVHTGPRYSTSAILL